MESQETIQMALNYFNFCGRIYFRRLLLGYIFAMNL